MAKYLGKGGQIQVMTAPSPEVWLTFAQVQEIGGLTVSSDEVDVTTLDDNVSGLPADYQDFLQGFKDPGEMPITVIFDPNLATHNETTNGLYELFDSGRTATFRVKYPTSPVKYLRFQGFIRDFETPTINASDPVAATFTIRVRQKPVLGNS